MTGFSFSILFFCVFVFALMIGGYYGTIDYRIRKDLPLITFDCYCPICNHRLAERYQIPIFSWLFLKGRCAYCGTPISIRYPLLESCFLFFYCGTFLIFFRTPLAFLGAWIVYVTMFVLLRCEGHFRSACKGLLIMYGYHLLIGTLLYVILRTSLSV